MSEFLRKLTLVSCGHDSKKSDTGSFQESEQNQNLKLKCIFYSNNLKTPKQASGETGVRVSFSHEVGKDQLEKKITLSINNNAIPFSVKDLADRRVYLLTPIQAILPGEKVAFKAEESLSASNGFSLFREFSVTLSWPDDGGLSWSEDTKKLCEETK